jgi:hypothetical protein
MAVMLDFVDPIGGGRRPRGHNRLGGDDEPSGNTLDPHGLRDRFAGDLSQADGGQTAHSETGGPERRS